MNDMILDEPTSTSSSGSGGYLMDKVEELLDLAATKHIQDEPLTWVAQSEDRAWNFLYENYAMGYGSAEEFRQAYEMEGLVVRTDDGRIGIDRHGANDTYFTFYIKGEQAWENARNIFSFIREQVECIESLDSEQFSAPALRMQLTRERLTPVTNIEDAAGDLLDSGAIPEPSGDGDGQSDEMDRFYGSLDLTSNWDSANTAATALSAWTGAAAETFYKAFLGRLPSILAGQAMTARVLEDSLVMMQEGHRHGKIEGGTALFQAIEVMEMYPFHNPPESRGLSWSDTLDVISGVGGFVAAVAAPIPGPGTAISATSGIIAGTASLVNTFIDEDPAQKEVKGRNPMLEGDTALEVMMAFSDILRGYLDTLDNMENFISRFLSGYEEAITADGGGMNIYLTWGDNFQLSTWNAFFVPKDMSIGAIDEGSSPEQVMDSDYFGEATPITASDIEALVQAGVEYLPSMGQSYGFLAGKDHGSGVASAFERVRRYSGPGGGGAEASAGMASHTWEGLEALLQTMLSQSDQSMNDAGRALVVAARTYAQVDDENRRYLEENSVYLEELGLD